jgi:hypothetical protein
VRLISIVACGLSVLAVVSTARLRNEMWRELDSRATTGEVQRLRKQVFTLDGVNKLATSGCNQCPRP